MKDPVTINQIIKNRIMKKQTAKNPEKGLSDQEKPGNNCKNQAVRNRLLKMAVKTPQLNGSRKIYIPSSIPLQACTENAQPQSEPCLQRDF